MLGLFFLNSAVCCLIEKVQKNFMSIVQLILSLCSFGFKGHKNSLPLPIYQKGTQFYYNKQWQIQTGTKELDSCLS